MAISRPLGATSRVIFELKPFGVSKIMGANGSQPWVGRSTAQMSGNPMCTLIHRIHSRWPQPSQPRKRQDPADYFRRPLGRSTEQRLPTGQDDVQHRGGAGGERGHAQRQADSRQGQSKEKTFIQRTGGGLGPIHRFRYAKTRRPGCG